MKRQALSVVATALFVGFAAVNAAAQCPCSGKGGAGASSGAGIPMTETRKTPWEVVLKLQFSPEMAPTGLKQAIGKVRDVERVDIDEKSGMARIQFTGTCEKLASLELAFLNSGVAASVTNHAHILVAVSPMKGKTAEFCKASEALSALDGVVSVSIKGGYYELHADLSKVTRASIGEAAKSANFDVQVNASYEYVTYKVTAGEVSDFVKEVGVKRGVMTVTANADQSVSMWVRKALVNVKKDVEGLSNFKVEKL